MSAAAAVNGTATGKMPLNKMIGIAMAAYAVIEAVVSYFVFFGPLYIKPVFVQCDTYNAEGVTCMVKMFGKTFASAEEIANYQVILTLWDVIVNIILIYIVAVGIPLLLSFCFIKGFAFAKSYLIAVFGAKAIVGVIPLLIPFANLRNSMRIFGAIDAVICLALSIYCVYLNSLEYADDMLFTDEETKAMFTRAKNGGIMFGLTAVTIICESLAMNALGSAWSLYLGWLSATEITQGCVLTIILAAALVAAILYVREGDWAEYFFLSFGAAICLSNIAALIMRITSGGFKFTRSGIFLIVTILASGALTAFAFMRVKNKISFKPLSNEDKLPALVVNISAGSIIVSFILTVAAVTMWHKIIFPGSPLGAMDIMYFIVYGGITLFLALAMIGGYSFTKFGTLALYLVVASCNFQSIFVVLSSRSAMVQVNLAQGIKYVGYNYIITAILYIAALISCLVIIIAFVFKGVNDYLYQKRFS